jgi:hypothetical protein
MSKYEKIATAYAEAYGIIDYKIQGCKMVYYINYKENAAKNAYKPGYKGDTYKATVDLKTGKENRQLLKRYNEKGWLNR